MADKRRKRLVFGSANACVLFLELLFLFSSPFENFFDHLNYWLDKSNWIGKTETTRSDSTFFVPAFFHFYIFLRHSDKVAGLLGDLLHPLGFDFRPDRPYVF